MNTPNDVKLKEQQYNNSGKFNARIYLHAKFSTNKYPWPIWLFDQIEIIENAKVLELGCGNGLFWRVNANRIPANWDVILSDFSEGMLKDSKKSLSDSKIDFKYEVVNAEDIKYPDNTFDIVIANLMLYHVHDREKALSEINRVLKENGVLYSATIGKNNMTEMKEIIKEFNPLSEYDDVLNTIIDNFSLETGTLQLKNHFNKVDMKRYEDSLIITETEPLVEYALSCNGLTPDKIALEPNKRDEFKEFINNKIKKDGKIHISKDFGLFISKNPKK